MNIREARETMYELLALFFKGAAVVHGSQSHAVKEKPPVVVLTTISVNRPMNPPTEIVDGNPVSYYPTNMALQVDLYTKGALVEVGERQLALVENTALNDMIEFANFIGSEYFINWCHQKDIALALKSDAQDTTALINSASYQFRATLELTMSFTQKAVGYTGILDANSIKHSTPEGEAEGDDTADDVYFEPEYTPSVSGGGSKELAEESIGYFTEAEVKEEK